MKTSGTTVQTLTIVVYQH